MSDPFTSDEEEAVIGCAFIASGLAFGVSLMGCPFVIGFWGALMVSFGSALVASILSAVMATRKIRAMKKRRKEQEASQRIP